jgi:prephenate dehydrogenase
MLLDCAMTSNVDRNAPRALVIGLGLIGGSIASGLRAHGWHVAGIDSDDEIEQMALDRNVIDIRGNDPHATLVVAAVPADSVVGVLEPQFTAHSDQSVVFMDVSGVKTQIVETIEDSRFVGSHPMAGSEQSGLSGARADLFVGASWVLTPGPQTSPDAYATAHDVITTLGAQGVSLLAADHDRIVALVSHLPHLLAVSLMNEASSAAADDQTMLQLAAGGFRDMTRIAAGDPEIWPDVCLANRDAIVAGLDELIGRMEALREILLDGDRSALHSVLDKASQARNALPARVVAPRDLCEIRIPVLDRPGVLAEVTTVASDLGVSVFDIEIAHSTEGDRGVLILVVNRVDVARYAEHLGELGYATSTTEL